MIGCSIKGKGEHMATNRTESTKIGIAWYDPEQFKRLLELADDKDELESTWEEWVENAQYTVNLFEQQGIKIQKIHIDMDELQKYCMEKGYPNTSESRSEFVADILGKRNDDKAPE